MGNLLGDSVDITTRSPLKVRRLDDTSVATDVSAETVTFQYDNSGALASATGQAAGTMIYAKLTYDGILNSFKDKGGDMKDSSFAFVTGTVLTTALTIDVDREVDNWRRMTVTEKFAEMAKHMKTNGQYWVDHADGAVWGIAAAQVANDTANYSYKAPISGGSTGDKVDLIKVGGETATLRDFVFPTAEYQATTNGRDGTVVYASASTLTLSGVPFIVNSEDLVYVREVDATGNTAEVWINGLGNVHMEISSGTITKSGGSDFSANGVYELGYNGQAKGYNAPSFAHQIEDVNPVWAQAPGETLADVTNGADDTYYYYVDMSGFRKAGFQLTLDGGSGSVTVTCEGTLQDDGTAAASCTYQDITNDTFGVNNTTATDMWIDNAEKLACFKYVRLKVVASTGAADDADWTIYHKRLY